MACQILFDELMSCQIQPENNLLSLSFKKRMNSWSWLVFKGTTKSNFLVCKYLKKEVGFKFTLVLTRKFVMSSFVSVHLQLIHEL